MRAWIGKLMGQNWCHTGGGVWLFISCWCNSLGGSLGDQSEATVTTMPSNPEWRIKTASTGHLPFWLYSLYKIWTTEMRRVGWTEPVRLTRERRWAKRVGRSCVQEESGSAVTGESSLSPQTGIIAHYTHEGKTETSFTLSATRRVRFSGYWNVRLKEGIDIASSALPSLWLCNNWGLVWIFRGKGGFLGYLFVCEWTVSDPRGDHLDLSVTVFVIGVCQLLR